MPEQTNEASGSAGGVTAHWLGAAGLAIVRNGRCVLVDPYFSRLPLLRLLAGTPQPDPARIAAAWQRLPGVVSAVAVSHTHLDHALDIPALARLSAVPIFGSVSLAALLSRAGQPQRITVCHPGDTRELPGLGRLAIFAGTHGGILFGRSPLPGEIDPDGTYPLHARDYRTGAVSVFDLTIANRRFVHVGSAGVPTSALPEGDCDILFLCVPGWRAQPNYPAVYLRRLRPRLIVPIHFDRMTRPLDDPRLLQQDRLTARLLDLPGFLARLRAVAPGIRVQLPQLWEKISEQ